MLRMRLSDATAGKAYFTARHRLTPGTNAFADRKVLKCNRAEHLTLRWLKTVALDKLRKFRAEIAFYTAD